MLLRRLLLQGSKLFDKAEFDDLAARVGMLEGLTRSLSGDLKKAGVDGDIGKIFCQYGNFFKM